MPVDPELKKRGNVLHFDHIFDMDQRNIDLFEVMAKPIIDAAINGFNGTIFAYGQTSSGKTYSMMGSDENPGVIPLAINYMFDKIKKTCSREFLLRVSNLEVYNERVNDLLDKDRLDLKVKENTNTKQVIVDGCKEKVFSTSEMMLKAMKSGDNIRKTGETNMNERSSRSHTIFRITIESRELNACEGAAVRVSQLNLVDLAGSERARQTGATGERFNEGRYINLSLCTLGLVIMQLSERAENPSKFINFRDSKLTRILQDSLGGNAMTAIICAVTPAALEETQCTLAFASRAKKVNNKPQVNEVLSEAALLKCYRNEITKLRMEMKKLKSTDVGKMESALIENKRTNQKILDQLALLETSIVSGNSSSEAESLESKAKRRRKYSTLEKDEYMENTTLKSSMSSLKSTVNQPAELRIEYESLLQEKNRIALELEDKKTTCLQLEKKHEESTKEIDRLKTTNKDLDEKMNAMLSENQELKTTNKDLDEKMNAMLSENQELKTTNKDLDEKMNAMLSENQKLKTTNKDLDEEMDDIVRKIHELERENIELIDKLFTIKSSGTLEDTKALKDRSEKLEIELEQLKSQRDQIRGELESVTRTLESFKNENSELRVKVAPLDRGDSLSCDSSRRGSPALEAVRVDNRRRRSTTELFNQKIQLDNLEMHETNCCGQCRCATLQEEVIKLERELVTKNGHIAALEIRIQSLLQEKNRIALELEDTKTTCLQLKKKHEESTKEIDRLKTTNKDLDEKMNAMLSENQKLKTTNKDLDEEMDDIVRKIHELERENIELIDKLFTIKSSGTLEDTKALKDRSEKLEIELEQLKSQRDQIRGELESVTRTLESFKNENSELRVKVAPLDRGDSLSCDSSRRGSPALEAVRVDNRRRRSTTELFNQKIQLDNLEMHETNCCGQCRCATLQEEVIKLERELVTKNGHIAALEIRIECENVPHMKRCKDLEELNDFNRRKCKKLEAELQKVREMKLTELSSECDKCRHWRSNKCDQSTQCLPPSEKLYLSGMSSGIVEDHIRMEKLRKTNDRLKEICRGRNRVVQELQYKIKELEKQLNISANQDEKSGSGGAPALCSTSKSDFAVNSRQ